MIGAVLLILAAAVAVALAQKLRLPAIPILVVTGAALAALPGVPTIHVDQPVPQLALAFLVFAVGLEFEPARLSGQLRGALRLGLSQFLAIGAVGVGLALLLGYTSLQAAYLGLGLAASSTIIGVRSLVERGQIFEPLGRLILGVLLVQDLLLILSTSTLASIGEGIDAVLLELLSALVLFALAWGVVRVIAPRIARRLDNDPEVEILSALAVLFAFIAIAWFLHLPYPVGAFLAGVSLAAFPAGGMIRAPITPVAGFFSAVFFVSLGSSMEVPAGRDLVYAALALVVVMVGTPVVVVTASRGLRVPRREAFEAGILLGQCGELTLVLAVLGRATGTLDSGLFSAISLVTVVSMMLTPLLVSDRLIWWLVGRFSPSRPTPLPAREGHVVMLGCGRNSRMLLDLLRVSSPSVVVVDRDPGVVAALREQGIEALCGEGAEEAMLDAVHARQARAVVSTMRRQADNLRMLRRLRGEGGPVVLVRVFDDHDATSLERHGATVISEAEVAAAEVMLVAPTIARAGAAAHS